jgi:hypothetical protein
MQLRRLAEQIYAQPLDRSRPLWEAWLLEGLEAGRWAILNKVHGGNYPAPHRTVRRPDRLGGPND